MSPSSMSSPGAPKPSVSRGYPTQNMAGSEGKCLDRCVFFINSYITDMT